jgi:hypothetical protein
MCTSCRKRCMSASPAASTFLTQSALPWPGTTRAQLSRGCGCLETRPSSSLSSAHGAKQRHSRFFTRQCCADDRMCQGWRSHHRRDVEDARYSIDPELRQCGLRWLGISEAGVTCEHSSPCHDLDVRRPHRRGARMPIPMMPIPMGSAAPATGPGRTAKGSSTPTPAPNRRTTRAHKYGPTRRCSTPTLASFTPPYTGVRQAADPDAVLLEFLQSTYEAVAEPSPRPRNPARIRPSCQSSDAATATKTRMPSTPTPPRGITSASSGVRVMR